MRSWSIALVALAVAAMASGHAASAAGRDAPATTGPAPLRNQAAAPSRVPSPAELEAIKAKAKAAAKARESQKAAPEARPSKAKASAATTSAAAPKATVDATTPAAAPAAAPDRAAVSSHAIALPQGQGKVEGLGESFSVQASTGIATFAVPIPVPPARGAVDPAFSLHYKTSGGAGLAGIGWDMGVPFIARETNKGVPRYDDRPGIFHPEQDRFVFGGGQALVPICVIVVDNCAEVTTGERFPSWADGWQYFRSAVEGGYQRFFWAPNGRTWRVQEQSGNTWELGEPLEDLPDTSAIEADPEQPTHIYKWNVARQYDPEGGTQGQAKPTPRNAVRYRYFHKDGAAYLQDVYYTNPATAVDTGDLASYGVHVHFAYEARPDATTSFRTGYRVRMDQRITRVDVTTKPFDAGGGNAVPMPRVVLRRVHLTYDPAFHQSYLLGVQAEGREPVPATEGADGLLPPTSGERLPAMRLTYTHVGPAAIDGFEPFDTQERPIVGAPALPFSDPNVTLMDVDQDGLPDMVHADPSRYRALGIPSFGWFKNGQNGTPGRFSSAIPLGLGLLGSDQPSDLRFSAPNVAALDLDGNGIVDFFHLPPFATSARVYTLQNTGTFGANWQLKGRTSSFPLNQAANLQLFQDGGVLRVADVNGDGLVDFVRLTGTQLSVYDALGRQPGGDGLFGTGRRTGPHTAQLSEFPHAHCVPTLAPGIPARFDDAAFRLADLNGDGLLDLAYIATGTSVKYWPGRGTGYFGTGEEPAPGTAFCPSDRWIAMPAPAGSVPTFASPDETRLEDINGDGLEDLVHLGPSRIRVWLNLGGEGFAAPRDITGVNLARPGGLVPVRVVDIDGSGTRDLVYGDVASGLVYRDLSGGQRPGLLVELATGLGKTTELSYTTSIKERFDAAAAGTPWTTTMPLVVHLVKTSTVRDHLGVVGRPDGNYVTTYAYRDPVYDPRRRDFQGFKDVETRALGDASSPTIVSRESFLLPACEDLEPEAGIPSPCVPAGRYRDDPLEALSGLGVESHVLGVDGTPFSTSHRAYKIAALYTGLDGRRVRQITTPYATSFLYDTKPGSDRTPYDFPVQDVYADVPLNASASRNLHLYQTYGTQGTFKYHDTDIFGQSPFDIDYGCNFGCTPLDESIQAVHYSYPVADDPGGWMFRPSFSYVMGAPAYEVRRSMTYEYDGFGHLLRTTGELGGTLPLDRFHASGGTIAPAPTGASVDATINLGEQTYDVVGNVVAAKGPNGRCSSVAYSTDYGDLPVSETTYAGTTAASGCGTTQLTTTAQYDRGYGKVTDAFDLHGEHTTAVYDGFGRTVVIYAPRPGDPTTTGPLPHVYISYDLPTDDRARPYTSVYTFTLDGIDDNTYEYKEAWSIADGLGRSIVTFAEADLAGGDGGTLLAQGLNVYDAKGNVIRAYEPFFFSGNPLAMNLGDTPPSPSITMGYDALGRLVDRHAQDGTYVLHTDYRGFLQDTWDAADLTAAHPQHDTYVTTQMDGHGRSLSVTERERVGGNVISRTTEQEYLSSGEVDLIRRTTESGTVVRWMRYDTLGRMVANVEPHATTSFNADKTAALTGMHTLRYAWNDAGDLVGTSDARGCGQNFFYDYAGRMLAEDYSPCDATHAVYTAPNLTTGDGTEVWHRYDTEDPAAATAAASGFVRNTGYYLGREASVSDRARKTLMSYDGRGRSVSTAVQIAKTGVPTSALSTRYTARWYAKGVTYDNADRIVSETTGGRSTSLMGAGGASRVDLSYTGRGTLLAVNSSYGLLANGLVHAADGTLQNLTYGDLAATQTTFTYDARKRITNVLTQRLPPALWGTGNANYTPPVLAQTAQLTLANTHVTYDLVDNPTLIEDLRPAAEWPAGHKPVTRAMTYDGLNRVTGVTYTYTGVTNDPWSSPHAPEHAGTRGPGPLGLRGKPKPEAAFTNRVKTESYAYDGLGNRTSTDDDVHGFWDRSLGTESHDGANGKPYQLTGAQQATGSYAGTLTAAYDAMGNTTSISVSRPGVACTPTGANCSQRFAYTWDEANRLVRARRWDGNSLGVASSALPVATPASDLEYAYDGGDSRVRTTTTEGGTARHTVYVFTSLELRKTSYVSNEYTLNDQVEAVYLTAAGERLAKLVPATALGTLPAPATGGAPIVLLEMQDMLGSTSVIVDKASGELVENRTYRPYGDEEQDYRTARWQNLREDYGFTGKESDVEVGLIYFGKRFLVPSLGRWLNPDPLALHAPGKADLNLYAYVSGRVFTSVDPLGLTPDSGGGPPTAGDTDSGGEAAANTGRALWNGAFYLLGYPIAAFSRWASGALRSSDGADAYRRSVEAPHHKVDTMGTAMTGPIVDATPGISGELFLLGTSVLKNTPPTVRFEDLPKAPSSPAGGPATSKAPVPVAKVAKTPAAEATRSSTPKSTGKTAKVEATARSSGCGPGGCGLDPTCFTAGTVVATGSGLVPIETIRVGDRVLSPGDDPAVQSTTAVDASWVVLRVSAPSPDRPEDTIEVSLLRPAAWVEALGAVVGGWVPLTIAELGVDGFAKVRAIESAPDVRAGPGHVVLMTVTHENRDILRIRLRETGEDIEPTGLHPLFSVDRNAWVGAAKLFVGERLKAGTGVVTIEQIGWRSPAQVYNFEIEGTHAYLVGRSRLWSHNAGTCVKKAHKNADLSTVDNHRYEIFEKKNGNVVKTGISGQDLNKNGDSPRANRQVNEWNEAEGFERYDARVVETKIPGRPAAKVREQLATDRLFDAGHTLSRQTYPKPSKLK